MARSIWKGAISFGMVRHPDENCTSLRRAVTSVFVQLHASCHSRLRQKRWCPHHEEEVPYADIVRGFEFTKDEYLVMEDEDFEALPLKTTHTIDILRFVDLQSIDPVHYEKSYYIEPESVGVKPFYLLKKALESTNRVAIAKIALRQKEHLCLVRPYGGRPDDGDDVLSRRDPQHRGPRPSGRGSGQRGRAADGRPC